MGDTGLGGGNRGVIYESLENPVKPASVIETSVRHDGHITWLLLFFFARGWYLVSPKEFPAP